MYKFLVNFTEASSRTARSSLMHMTWLEQYCRNNSPIRLEWQACKITRSFFEALFRISLSSRPLIWSASPFSFSKIKKTLSRTESSGSGFKVVFGRVKGLFALVYSITPWQLMWRTLNSNLSISMRPYLVATLRKSLVLLWHPRATSVICFSSVCQPIGANLRVGLYRPGASVVMQTGDANKKTKS